jgi:hypothetical protein
VEGQTVIASVSEAIHLAAQKKAWIASSLSLPCANAIAFVAGNDAKFRQASAISRRK